LRNQGVFQLKKSTFKYAINKEHSTKITKTNQQNMKISLATILFTSGILFLTTNISMLGVKINDSKTNLKKIKLEVIAHDDSMTKYRTENGNDFSITVNKGKVVYMENDWLQDSKGKQPLFSNFEFGKTSLKEIREKFGTNGFTHKQQSYLTTETDLIMFNCFEFDSSNNEVLAVITKVPLNANVTEENVASNLKLDAIIIADKEYLDKIWGAEKTYDPNYKKIKL
jgi:hypothetical protein